MDKNYDAFWFIDFIKLTDMIGFVSFSRAIFSIYELVQFSILFGFKKESFFLYSEKYLITQFNCILHLAKISPLAFGDNFI